MRGKIINSEKNRINKVLSNTEIQAMITAIGTGFGDEFDIANLRYGRVIVMTDADVDGAHIRTLILTFLYRTMPELFERGHVYIAVPPLYHVKLGSRGMYFEKDAQLEELLVRERVKDMTVSARGDLETTLTEARWTRLVREIGNLEAWAAKLEAEFGPAARFAISHRLVEAEAGGTPDAAALIASLPANGYVLTVEEELGELLHVRVVETETSTAHRVDLPIAMLDSSTYGAVQRAYAKVVEIVGLPPFTVAFGNKSSSRGDVRRAAAELPRPGEGRHADQPLQGPRRDEPRAALGDHHGSDEAHAHSRRGGGRSRGRQGLLDADG